MHTTITSTGSPGIALGTLFRNSKPDVLGELIGQSVLDTINGLDPKLSSELNLGELVANMIDPSAALKNIETRNQILRLLPLSKARELGQRLGLVDNTKIYVQLCDQPADRHTLDTLTSFFGVVSDERAEITKASSTARVTADYALFDHQRQASKRVERAIAKPPHKVVLHMPTGSGKTRTAMHVIANHLREHEPTLICWLAQNSELLDQAADELERSWSFLGNREIDVVRFWGARRADLLDARDGVVIAGLAKMASVNNRDPSTLLRMADRVSLTIIDEAHQAIAPTYESVLTALYSKRPQNALIGLTATPGRSWSNIDEDLKLSEYFESNKVTLDIEGYSNPVAFLIDQGYLARPKFRTLNARANVQLTEGDIRSISTGIDLPSRVLERLGSDSQRNVAVLTTIEELMQRHKRIIVFSPSVYNARILKAILSCRGYEAHLVTGESQKSDRETAIRRFKGHSQGKMILVNYGVLTTGFDAPATSAAVIARPTRSLVLYSQMIGRATRGTRAGGNHEAEIVTVVDPHLPGFGSVADAFKNWEDVWNESSQ